MLPDAGGQRKVVDSSGELVYVSGGAGGAREAAAFELPSSDLLAQA